MDISSTGYLMLFLSFFVSIWIFASIRKKYKKWPYFQESSPASVSKPMPGVPLWTYVYLHWGMTRWFECLPKYGRITAIKFLKFRFVIINDFQLGKELFNNPVFCGRKITEVLAIHSNGAHGLVSSDGKRWRDQRKFIHQNLREFGFGQKSNAASMRLGIEATLKSWKAKQGQRFSPNKDFYIAVLNASWILLTGKRAGEDDDKLADLAYEIHEGFGLFEFPGILLSFTKMSLKNVRRLYTWLPIFSGIKRYDQSVTNLRTHLHGIVSSRKQQLASTQDKLQPNLVDTFIAKIDLTTDPESEFFQQKGEQNLMAIMTEFFIAGGDTTSSMLTWLILHLIRNPDIQEQMQNEIDQVVGSGQLPSLDDRKSCPLTEAFILEVLRVSPVATAGVPHSTTESTNVGPYFIEKGTVVCLNIYGIHHDPKIWGDPHQFRPQRFLSEDGKTVVKNEAMCAFSLGTRRCIGEQTGRDMLFLFVSAICQRFTLKPDPHLKTKQPLCAGMSGFYSPTKFHMVAVDRWE